MNLENNLGILYLLIILSTTAITVLISSIVIICKIPKLGVSFKPKQRNFSNNATIEFFITSTECKKMREDAINSQRFNKPFSTKYTFEEIIQIGINSMSDNNFTFKFEE